MNYLFLALAIFAHSLSNSALAQAPEDESQVIPEQTVVDIDSNNNGETVYLQDKSVYVSDEFHVPLRSSPCARCTIVHWGLKSGTKMRLLEIVDGWGHLITDKGIEGWMEEQYLVDEPIARIKVQEQQGQLAALKKRNDELNKTVSELRQASKAIRGKLDNTEDDKSGLAKELADLKEISSDAVALDQQNKQLVKNNHMLQRENDALKANVDDLQKDRRNESFLYGGLTVFLGAILVILIPKLRGRKRFSEWQ